MSLDFSSYKFICLYTAILFATFLFVYIKNKESLRVHALTWKRGERFYHCISCYSVKELTICCECFSHSQHNLHNYKSYISEFNGACDCGDDNVMSMESFCEQHKDCDKNLSKFKETFNNDKQINKLSMLLNTNTTESKRLAKLNKIESVCELAFKGKLIKDYFKNTQVHKKMLKLTNVYAVYRKDHENEFRDKDLLNETRMLLSHGTKRENLKGIFDTGLQLPLKAGMFGNGIYFADRVSKSANYSDCGYECQYGISGVLLLCEVAVGRIYEVKTQKSHLTEPPDGYQSVKGLGKNVPSSICTYRKTNIIVPSGTTIQVPGYSSQLDFNEYIVYDPRRVLIRFFLDFECT